MKVKISKRGNCFEADPVEMPGSPPVGRGNSIKEALGDFLIHYQQQLGVDFEVDKSAAEAEQVRRNEASLQR